MRFFCCSVLFFSLFLFTSCAPQSVRLGNLEWTLASTATYTWDEANKACPAGFHLPHLVEMEAMENARRSDNQLKPAWCFGEKGDVFEAGLCYTSAYSVLWTSVEAGDNTAYVWDVELDYSNFRPQVEKKDERHSILCVKD